jgi:hypothetical protein
MLSKISLVKDQNQNKTAPPNILENSNPLALNEYQTSGSAAAINQTLNDRYKSAGNSVSVVKGTDL